MGLDAADLRRRTQPHRPHRPSCRRSPKTFETAQLQEFYEALNLSLEFDPIEKTLDGAALLSTLHDTVPRM
ncbi:MAG: hypothetical protein QOJ77_2427 [Microbacteriaceae bacterium]|nr:hypothetical protein [Microbacteriaceae bacterium]